MFMNICNRFTYLLFLFSLKTIAAKWLSNININHRVIIACVIANIHINQNYRHRIYNCISHIHLSSEIKDMSEHKVVKPVNRRHLLAKNPWHFVSPGENAPKVVRAII